jgi:predicted nuclease of predicted toxin-antitoxin system
MSFRFLVDSNLPRKFARDLVALGYKAKHAHALGLRGRDDEEIWKYAVEHDFIIITKDTDFLDYMKRDDRTRIVLDRRGNQVFGEMVEGITSRMKDIEEQLEKGAVLYEIG